MRSRHRAGCRVIVERAADRYTLICDGPKDLWQHRSHYVANTRWWPPFCLVVDSVVAAILVVLIAAGVDFHH